MSERTEFDDDEVSMPDLNPAERILLLLVGESEADPIPGNLWLQKEMFLVAKNFQPLEEFLAYEPNVQGPYSESVNNILEDLQYRGLARKEGADILPTRRGREVATVLRARAKEPLPSLVSDVRDLLNDLTKDEVLAYIYYSFPEMTVESLEIEQIEQSRGELAKRLYEKGKISREKASELAGVPLHEFKV